MSVLAVTSIKGGVGKTTTAVNLAWLSARDGTPTLAWDLDPQGATSFTFRVRPGVSAGAAKLLRDEDALAESIKATDYPGLDLLPADFSYRKLDAILMRSDRKGGGLQRALSSLRAAYGRIVLDCPPGFSVLAENVFSAADALAIPTIPTVLSLRTLARLARHVAERRDRCPALLPFLNLVDRRRGVHREIAERVRAAGGLWLDVSIPQASVIEQMGVERAPVGVYAALSPQAADFERLWTGVLAALARPADDSERRQRARSLADEVDLWLVELERAADDAPPAPRGAAESAADSCEHVALRLELDDATDLATLVEEAGLAHAPSLQVEQLVHAFDTGDGALRRAGATLHLHEERGRFTLRARLAGADEVHAGLDARWAFELLAGSRSPLEVLAARLAPADAPLPATLAALLAGGTLERVSSTRTSCRRIGPVALPPPAPPGAAVALEIRRIDRPGERTTSELLVLTSAGAAAACRQHLTRRLQRAGVEVGEQADAAPATRQVAPGGAASEA